MLLVVVIYNKRISDLQFLKTYNKSQGSVIDIFLYDNSKKAQSIPQLEGLNIYYEHDENNSGVSRAYNRAYLKARELEKNVMLLLDQDTDFKLYYLEKYMNSYARFKNDYLYAPIVCSTDMQKIYSPFFLNGFVGKVQSFNSFKFEYKYDLSTMSVINSGLMIPLNLFEKIGGYNEKLKLDFSDVYFIERYKNLNNKIILVDVYLEHSLSGDEGKNFNNEYIRYMHYCNGAKELSTSLALSLWWVVLRRMLILVLKYKSSKFIGIYFHYFLKGLKI